MNSALEGVANFRDVAAASDKTNGPAIRAGRLFRSDSLHSATAADIRYLSGQLGIGAVLDLRAIADSVPLPHPYRTPRMCYANVPLYEIEQRAFPDNTDDVLSDVYVEHLSHDPNLPVAIEILAKFLSRQPTLVFCTAGKDRTGMVVALTLGLAGVPHNLIIRDYLLSAKNMPRVVEKLRNTPRHRDHLRRFPAAFYECHENSIRKLLDTIAHNYGSIDGWAKSAGIAGDTGTQLRTVLR